jgi:sister-chromatid-cohesion protein PDS5
LKDLDQEEVNKKKLAELDPIAAALVTDTLLKNKDKDVRLQTACCLADIIRLYAPDAPYDESQLEVLFFFPSGNLSIEFPFYSNESATE